MRTETIKPGDTCVLPSGPHVVAVRDKSDGQCGDCIGEMDYNGKRLCIELPLHCNKDHITWEPYTLDSPVAILWAAHKALNRD
jgi:hypothetical protein